MTGSCYFFREIKGVEPLFNDADPIGKIFKFRKPVKFGDEWIQADYLFKVEREQDEYEKEGAAWAGWKSFEGLGKPEGYRWAGGSIHIRDYQGGFQSIAI